ncbi:MAG: Opr family porin [Halarcobacter sp.]
MNKKIKLSLLASSLLLVSTSAFAESNSIKDAFANGKTSGDITVYTVTQDNSGAADAGFTVGSIGLGFETDTVNGFSAAIGFRAQHEFDEENNGDYAGEIANDAIAHTAVIKYANENFFLSVGRQEIDLEWLGDYNESVVAGITAVPDTTIVLGYTDRQAEIGFDHVDDFSEITKDGAYVLDVKYNGIENVELNPYFYSAPDVADFYGLKASYDNDMFGFTAHYAASSEDTGPDGDVYNLEARAKFAGISAALGYIGTDKTVGAGSIPAYGDNMNPLDEAGYAYGADEETVYGSLSYEISGIALTAIYGTTETAGGDADELNLIAEYNFSEQLSGAITYVDYDDKGLTGDFDKVYANLTYSF